MKGVKMRKNKHYSKEFKESTIQLVLNSNEPVRKIAEDLDIKYNTLPKLLVKSQLLMLFR
jgi:transposase-like protein